MEKIKKSYMLKNLQLEESSRIVKELRKKHSKYDFLICETVLDNEEYFLPTKEELDLIEED